MNMTLDPQGALFWYYIVMASVVISLAGVLYVAWRVRRDTLAALLGWLFVWIAVDLYIKALLRSPQTVVPGLLLLHAARVAAAGEAWLGFLLVDLYFSRHNGHLSLLRKIVRWWDPNGGTWNGDEHGR